VEPIVLPRWQAYAHALRGVVSNKPLAVWLYHSKAMMDAVQRIASEDSIDLAYVYHLRMGQYLEDIGTVPRCIALQPVQTLNLQRFRRHARHPLWKLFYTVEYQRMVRYEPTIARKFDRCLLISDADRRSLDAEGKLDNVFFSPHGVDINYFAANTDVLKEPHAIVFHASMRYRANTDAVLYFVEEIYPRVKEQVPDAKLYVVGYQPPPSVRALARDPSIAVTGFVEDVRAYLNRAEVAIDPLRVGAGLQNKVLESMSMGLPVVATSVANEGIAATPDTHILVADDAETFARHILLLFANKALRRSLGHAARAFVEDRWSWEAHYAPLERLFEQLVAERRGVSRC
jgi:sugar transferase (PEP-CTERM/EpsH1 system associated)